MKSHKLGVLFLSVGLALPVAVWAKSAQEYLVDAQTYQKDGKKQEALIQFKNALKEDPKLAEARVLLGLLYVDNNQFGDAEKELQRAKELGVSRERWLLALSTSLIALGKADQALTELKVEAGDNTTFKAELFSLRGRAYLQAKKIDDARQAFLESLSLNPEQPEALLGQARLALVDKEPLKSLELVDKLLTRHDAMLEAWALKGDLLTRLRRYPEALAAFAQVIKLNPDLIWPYVGRAEINLEINKLDDAAKDIEQLQPLIKSGPMLGYLQAKLAYLKADYKTALSLTNEVLQKEARFTSAYMLLGRIQFVLGDFKAAKAALEKFNYEMKNPPETVRLQALAHVRLGELDKAVLLLRSLEKQFPNDASLKALLGSSLIQLKKTDEGMALLQKSVELAPDAAEFRTQLAMALLQTGSSDKAVAELQGALEKQPDLVQADILLITTLLQKRELDKAKQMATAFVARSKQPAVAHNMLGMVLLERDELDAARKEFNKASQEDPKFLASRLNLSRLAVKENKFDEAEQVLRDLLSVDKRYAPAIQGITVLLERKQQPKLVEEWLQKAWQDNRQDASIGVKLFEFYMQARRFQEAQVVANQLEQSNPDSTATYRALGMAYLAAGSNINALRNFNKLVNLAPERPEFYLLLAAAKVADKDTEGAMVAYQNAIRLKADFLQAWEAMISLEFKQGQKEQALKHIRELQQKYPQAPLAYELEGRYWLAEKKLPDALAMYQKSYQLAPRVESALVLSNLYSATGKRIDGDKILEKWLEKDPENTSIGFALASSWQSQGKTKPALAAYKKVFATNPKQLGNLNNLVWLAWTEKDPQLTTYLTALLALKPEQPLVLDTLGWVLLQTGDLEQGHRLLTQAYAKDDKLPDLRYHYAVSLVKKGDKVQAKSILQKLVDDGATFEDQAEARKLLQSL